MVWHSFAVHYIEPLVCIFISFVSASKNKSNAQSTHPSDMHLQSARSIIVIHENQSLKEQIVLVHINGVILMTSSLQLYTIINF